jgi:hypothetical protein
MPPAANFLAMPGGRLRLRFASPGGTAFDLPGDDCGAAIAGAVLEMCILPPSARSEYARRVNDASTQLGIALRGKAASQIHAEMTALRHFLLK